MGCAAFGPTIEILPFYGLKKKFEIRDNFLALTRIPRMNLSKIWTPITKEFPKIKAHEIPPLWKPIGKIDMINLVEELRTVKSSNGLEKGRWGKVFDWLYPTFIILVVMMIIAFLVYGESRIRNIHNILRARKDTDKLDKDMGNIRLKNLIEKVHSLPGTSKDEWDVKDTSEVFNDDSRLDQPDNETRPPVRPVSPVVEGAYVKKYVNRNWPSIMRNAETNTYTMQAEKRTVKKNFACD